MKKNFLKKLGLKSNVRVLNNDAAAEFDDLHIIEAIVFASREPIHIDYLLTKISKSDKSYLCELMDKLRAHYDNRGVNFEYNDNYCVFKTSPMIKAALVDEFEETRDLSKAAKETLAIIAYHQPTTRSEIEEIRGYPQVRVRWMSYLGIIGLKFLEKKMFQVVHWYIKQQRNFF